MNEENQLNTMDAVKKAISSLTEGIPLYDYKVSTNVCCDLFPIPHTYIYSLPSCQASCYNHNRYV